MLVGKEVIPGIDHLFLIENNEHPLCVESENSKKFQDELDRSVHYVVTSTSKEGTHKSDHPIHGYESMAQKISYFIKKRPKKTRGKKITNSFQSKIIEEWYREKALVSCHKMIKKPLIKMASNLNFLTTALYRKIKSNLGRDKLEDYFSNMIMLRFHCDEFRSDNDFINDYFQYNAVSHILNDSYLDEDSKVLWCSSEYDNFGNPSVTREVDWRSVIAPDVNMCPNKRYIIDNLPRSIPSHVVSFMRSVSFEQELKDVQHILFKSYLQRQVEENINSLLDSSVFDFDDLKKSLKLYNDFRHQFVNTFNNKKRKKHSPRKSMVIKSFCVDLGKSLFVSQPQSIVDSGFCFSSLLEITKSLCIERMDSYLKSNDQRIEKRKRIIKMRDKFLKDNPDAIDTFEVFGVNSFEFPPF
tara:strand:- start:1903 stop:3138 length:1236 start_codon:yes stop_codon:yes gene_type:complete